MTSIPKKRPLAFALALALGCGSVYANPAPGEIVSIQGTGEYRETTTAQWSGARVSQPLAGNSFVRTGSASAMSLVLADRSQIKLGQNSMFQVKSVSAGAGSSTLTELQKGKAWSQAKGSAPGPVAPAKGSPAVVMTTPTATAVINGTDWLVEVDDDGKTTVTVLTGQVALKNDQGEVTLNRNEQGTVIPGRAPEKQRVVDAADRVQWIASYTADWGRYPELASQPAVRDGLERGERAVLKPLPGALATLLAAELDLLGGDPKSAVARLEPAQGADSRARPLLARAYLQQGDFAAARRVLAAWQQAEPASAEAAWLQGETERLDGKAGAARAAYAAAMTDGGWRGRAWLGTGRVEAEREDVPVARAALEQAAALGATAEADLGLLETFAGRLDEARQYLLARLKDAPGDVTALTALGLLEIKSGNPEAALDALARAQAAEPRYARAAAYAGVAYYQTGRTDAAITSLQRASALDPRDPVPRLFLGQIARDRLDPEAALAESRAAAERMPNLKSLNQLANDQKGSADAGTVLAFAGMEEWAASVAQQAYYPYWGGSHLFLADRYATPFLKNAELMQGFLVDPLAFGANPKRSALLQEPGHHFSLGARVLRTDASHAVEPYFVANGLATASRPVAYFVEGLHTDFRPGEMPFSARSDNLTLGLGARPNSELSLFAYASRFDMKGSNLPLPAGILAPRVEGDADRVDIGLSYRLAPESMAMFKLGHGSDRITTDERSAFATLSRDIRRDSDDAQLRWGGRLNPRLELALGAETARQKNDERIGAGLFSRNEPARADSDLAWISLRFGEARGWLLQTDLFTQHQKQWRDDRGSSEYYSFERTQWLPRVGAMLPLTDNARLRAAWQDWRQPMSPGTLAPVATAGIPLADQTVLAGGEQKRLRLQGEWEATNGRAFALAFAESQRVDNIAFNAFDGAENRYQDLARLDRLRQFENAANFGNVEALEDRPVFTRGRIRQAGLVGNAMLGNNWSAYAGIVRANARNTSNWFDGLRLPWIPRQRATLGATWADGGSWRLQLQATHRSERFSDETNATRLAASWDGAVKLTWLSPQRNWQVETFAAQLGKKGADPLLGVNFVWRP